GNYVLDSDVLLETQREEFDVILCLSVTKWIHLNWGDIGLRRFFHRVYRHLRPGGLFILEPQPWSSYSKRKKLTETIYKNYFSIQLKPEQFSSFLTSEVGFSSYELLGTPNSSSRGFQRAIYLFYKGPAPRQ
ncbi:7SK snRNA methylphosphate capping enzyme, partial [Tachysurus ichikawai]